MNTLQNRIRGSLIGGAIGDALGYPIEFNSYDIIQSQYGEQGITRLDVKQRDENGDLISDKAVISDDTQMTLFTANGLLNASVLKVEPKFAVCRAYLEWYETQIGKRKGRAECWIRDIPELNKRRGPGITCLSALDAIRKGRDTINNSKGCGGVMRVAPVALYAVCDNRMDIKNADRLAGDTAEITHQHPLGYIPAALMSHIIFRLVKDDAPNLTKMSEYIKEGIQVMCRLYVADRDDVEFLEDIIRKAILLANENKSDRECIELIGDGKTGETALAIAVYCCYRYFDSFEHAMIASVNHGGDSDSTGAVTGNILGAAIGYEAIPQFYKDDLELHDLILHMADDLYCGEITL